MRFKSIYTLKDNSKISFVAFDFVRYSWYNNSNEDNCEVHPTMDKSKHYF